MKSINYYKGEHAQTQFWSNFEITKCCGYLEYQGHRKLINSLLFPSHVSMQVCWRKPHWFRRQRSENADFTVFKDSNLDNEATLKTRSKPPKSYQLFILPQYFDTIHISLARIHCSIQEISYKTLFWTKYDSSKCWYDLEYKAKVIKI